MATKAAVLADMRDEIVLRVYGVTPDVKPGEKWNCHEPTSATDFMSEAGNTRTFKVGWWRTRQLTVGSTSVRKHEVEGAIRIHYGKTDEDNDAAQSDADLIARALIDTTPTSTGVDYFQVPYVGANDPEETGEGDGILVTIPLFAVIETTA